MFSPEVQSALDAAKKAAELHRHEYLTVEHLLYGVLKVEAGERVLSHCGADIPRLTKAIEHFFEHDLERLPRFARYRLQRTVAFDRIIDHAATHTQSAGKSTTEIGDILAAILREPSSHAAYFLQEEGVTRLDVLNYLSHGVSKRHHDPVEAGEGLGPDGAPGKVNPLQRYTTNLTAKAREGKIDPLIGRQSEVRRAMRILARRRKNNPILVGDPGVGKTAIMEGIALRAVAESAPKTLRDAEIFLLDMGTLVAGTRYRGDFEERLRDIIEELKKLPNPILAIDEIHTVIGAGSTMGSAMDASNMLKPSLASGELRCIGSTTYDEFKRIFEKDHALSRRFQKVEITEPSVSETIEILRGLKPFYEQHHRVIFTDEALTSAAELSAKFITDRFLPDKAIDVMDEAGASISMNDEPSDDPVTIHSDLIEQIVADVAKVPVKTVYASEKESLRQLEESLRRVIFGQDEAILALSRAIKRSRAGLARADKPVGSFLLAGPTGVGKTELAKQLARLLGIEFLRFDMSEYMEQHSVARLIGAPPGYVGFDQGGLLTDAVRRHPHCVLLLDEIEKAHPSVFNAILLQVMDHATLTDSQNRKADFRNAVLLMTSNAGGSELAQNVVGFGEGREGGLSVGMKAIESVFTPEFRNRLDGIVFFRHLERPVLLQIVEKFLAELEERLRERGVTVRATPAALDWLAERGYDRKLGARPMSRTLQREVEDRLTDELLFGALEHGGEVLLDVTGEPGELVLKFTAAAQAG